MRLFFFIVSISLVIFATCSKQTVHVTLSVTADVPAGEHVFIAGTLIREQEWERRHRKLQQTEHATWETVLSLERGRELQFKITRGDWRTEAVDSSGFELDNYRVVANSDTTVHINVQQWRDQVRVPTVLSKSRLKNKGWQVELWENWKFHAGDDSAWAHPDWDDQTWITADTQLPAESAPATWNGLGWFRLQFQADSSIVGFPLSLHMFLRGAAEFYLDGQKLYSIGHVAATEESERHYWERDPKPLFINTAGTHVLAVRYSNHQKSQHFFPINADGFTLWIGNLDQAIEARTSTVRTASKRQFMFMTLPLSFAIVHFLLFIFYPQNKNNLYYALSMLGFAGMVFFGFQEVFITSVRHIPAIIIFELCSTIIAISFGMLTVYATVYKKLPKTWFAPFLVLGLATLATFVLHLPSDVLQIVMYVGLAAAILDMSRTTIISRKNNKEWGWIIGGGFTAALLVFAYQVLIEVGILRPIGGQSLVWMYGIPILAVSMSIHISLNFARTHRELRTQLVRVKELSDAALAQERRAKEEEIQRRLLQADNARKTEELEQARQLQFFMLPKTVPQLPHLEIAVSMQTATEVGGDYYDFFVQNGTLTTAIGDATGHGMKAGTMVAAIKSLFSAQRQFEQPETVLAEWSGIIRQMNLGNLYMAMALLRIDKHRLVLANAGMPPVFMYRAQNKRVEEIILKSMPLGGAAQFEYSSISLNANPGDTLLLMSDGFIELFNEDKEMFDERAKSTFLSVAHNSPQDIIQHLNDTCRSWRGDRPQHDDITFVLIKFT